MFTQIGSQSSNAQGGLGIGLSLAKGLVALHDGRSRHTARVSAVEANSVYVCRHD